MPSLQRKLALMLTAAVWLTSACSDPSAGQQQPAQSSPAPASPVSGKAGNQSITDLDVTPAALVIAPGAKQKLTVTGIAKNGSKKDMTSESGVVYQSSSNEAATVAADGTISISPGTRTGTRVTITVQSQGIKKEVPLTVKYALADTVTSASMVTNPSDIIAVVNKTRALPPDYAPDKSDLVEPNVPFTFKEKSEKKLMRTEAARALEKLFDQAAKEQIKLAGVSAYRSYASQKSIYNNNVKTQGEKLASQYSAKPGQSEHQTGLAIDVSSPSAKYALEEVFGTTPEGKWLAANAWKFGFILRYPKGKESITGYSYEPWHIRYVGIELAKEITEKGITLEEYFQDAVPVSKPSAGKP